MLDTISDSDVAFYHRNGFYVREGFLEPADLAQWREAVDAAVFKRTGHDKRTLAEKTDWEKALKQVMNLWKDNPDVRALMLDERLGKAAARLAGVDGIRIFHDQALIKDAGGRPTVWHQDLPYWSFTHRAAISIWVALDDATVENGCLWYVPGSQYTEVSGGVDLGKDADVREKVPQLSGLEAVPVPVKAGTAVWHTGLTYHYAGPNKTAKPRRAMTCAYMPDGSVCNGRYHGVQGDFKPAAGEKMDRDEVFPLIYSEKRVAALA
ncbi:MAG: phytanoyl-CoA dioxygenase family protein [Planctomycetota bacterium]|nr:phytanoyl-CoA dioxygenase family protein [Planctomycetota bacterium]